MNMKRNLLRLFPLLALLIFVACSSNPLTAPNAEISIISPDSLEDLENVVQGQTVTLSGVLSTSGEDDATITLYRWALTTPSVANRKPVKTSNSPSLRPRQVSTASP